MTAGCYKYFIAYCRPHPVAYWKVRCAASANRIDKLNLRHLWPKRYTYQESTKYPTVLKPHNALEESVSARHVVWMDSREVLKQYWEWCRRHSRAFASIAMPSLRCRYVVVEMDLYGLGAGGLDKGAGHEILRLVLEQPLKTGSGFFVSPVYVSACVPEKSAAAFAIRLCKIAQGALSLGQISHEEWLTGDMERTVAGGTKKSAFAPISGQARPEVIEALLKDDGAL